MSLLDRLKGDEDPRISSHAFFAALVAMRDGQITRAQLESLFGLSATGPDKAELDTVVNGYASAIDKHRYLLTVEAVFMLLEHPDFDLSKGQISSWLAAAELPI